MKSLYCSIGKVLSYLLYLLLAYLLLCLWRPTGANAQHRITGQLLSEADRSVLAGASVKIAGASSGTISDEEGRFSLSVSQSSARLVISFIGYRSLDTLLVLPHKEELILALVQDLTTLDEVKVSTGYWQSSVRLNTGNISKLGSAEIAKQPVLNPLQALQARLPGVFVQQQTGVPGGAFTVNIRGQSSLINGNVPLYVVDGVPVMGSTVSSFTGSENIIASANPLSIINPADIESIEVLKDADATAIYGSRGANGVVLITTKKGKEGKMAYNASFSQGLGSVSRRLPLLRTPDYIAMRREAFTNDEQKPLTSDYDVNGTWDEDRYTDWQKELTGGTARLTNAQLSMSVGSKQTQFLLSGGYYRETTVFPGENAYQRGSVNFSLNHASSDGKFKILFSGLYGLESNNLFSVDLSQYVNLPPNAPELYTETGDLNWANGTWNNPLSALQKRFKAHTDNLVSNAVFSYQITRDFQLRTNMGYTSMVRDEIQPNPLSAYGPYAGVTPQTIATTFAHNQVKTWLIQPQLTYSKTIAGSQFNVLLGGSWQESVDQRQRLRATGFSSDALIEQISAAATVTVLNAPYLQYRYGSVFGRFNYDLKQRYLVNLTARRDGSSRFGPGRRFANFWAVGAGWIFSREAFAQPLSAALNFGKIRVSYGTTGNDQIGDYRYMQLWGPTPNPYQGNPGLYPTRLANDLYGWEINRKAEAALELGFFGDRLFLSSAYFVNRSSNQLVNYSLPPSTGFTGVQANLKAVIENRGWELELTSKNVTGKSISWTTSFNITLPKSKLISFPGIEQSAYASDFQVGSPTTIQKRYHFAGVDSQTGLYQYEGFAADGQKYFGRASELNFPADLQAIKKIDRDLYGGLTNTFTVKGWQLDLSFQFVKQTGRNYMTGFSSPGTMSNQPRQVLNRWQKPGDQTDIQRFSQSGEGYFEYLYGARLLGDNSISDASFIRLKNLQVSYQIKTGQGQSAPTLKVYVQGQNLLTFTRFLGTDPEAQSILNLPPLRVVSAGFNLTF